jgi:diaminohydroxyphosphoribosylaminopyrimidine deaminase/5-amino-6-(5-phosphoribosylamino)uracil reductase
MADGAVARACRSLIAPFAMTMVGHRAFVVLKTATSLDGRVATRTGASRFITGPVSRGVVHALRDAIDAVVVGRGTVLADDPALSVRDHHRADGVAIRDPRRVVLDRRAQLPLTARVFDPPGALLVHEPTATPKPMAGIDGIALDNLDLLQLCRLLPSRGISSVLVEAGPRLAAAFLQAGVVDELWWFHAPLLIGGDGVAAVGSLGVEALTSSLRGDVLHHAHCGDDTLTILRPRR